MKSFKLARFRGLLIAAPVAPGSVKKGSTSRMSWGNALLALAVWFTLAGPSWAGGFICPDRLSFTIGNGIYQIPYCANLPIDPDSPNYDVTRVIVAIHGANRTAVSTFNDVCTAAQAAGADQTTLIIAPQFLEHTDVVHYHLGTEILFWTNNSWRDGDPSVNTDPQEVHVSSFELVDTLLLGIADGRKFPNLSMVIVSGHSAGGQFSQRFAAGSLVENDLSRLGLSMRYVIMNPGSLLYLDETRAVFGTDPLVFAPPDASKCPDYNNYAYGLDNLNDYMSQAGADTILAQYGERQVVYLNGELDNDPNDPVLDRSCAAMLEGANRFERGATFYEYLQKPDLYGPDIVQRHVHETVPGVGHDSPRMYTSSSSLRWLFD
jgi:hypothetical protein